MSKLASKASRKINAAPVREGPAVDRPACNIVKVPLSPRNVKGDSQQNIVIVCVFSRCIDALQRVIRCADWRTERGGGFGWPGGKW
eukprot:463635-Rhodomonas_salina.1